MFDHTELKKCNQIEFEKISKYSIRLLVRSFTVFYVKLNIFSIIFITRLAVVIDIVAIDMKQNIKNLELKNII
jgi:hypothetical protein